MSGTWKEFIDNMKEKWVGKKVIYDKKISHVVDVDYNGFLLIDRKTQFNDTTAVSETSVTIVKADLSA